jgi:hypothetical protein
MPGRGIVQQSWWGTAMLVVAAIGAATGTTAGQALGVVVAFVMFGYGCAAFAMAYARAVSRSRTDEISVAGLYLLQGDSAPRDVRRALLGSFLAQIVVATAGAMSRPFTAAAFLVLAPVQALGLTGLWAARYGTFPPRKVKVR